MAVYVFLANCLLTCEVTGTFERDSIELGFKSTGFRSLATSPDGKYLAAGDSNGSLHIYDLNNFDYTYIQVMFDLVIKFTIHAL